MTFTENRTYGVPEFAGTEVNRHFGKLKGLSGGQGKKGLHHNMENTLACEEVKQYMHLQAVSSPSSIIFVMTENIYFRKYLLL